MEVYKGKSWEDWVRDWSDVSTCQGVTRIAGNHQKLGDGQETDSPSEPPEGTSLVDTLISDFWVTELCENTFVHFNSPSWL